MDYTATLNQIADAAFAAAVNADIESGFLQWVSDAHFEGSAALQTTEDGRTAIILFVDDEDFEVADWYSERVNL